MGPGSLRTLQMFSDWMQHMTPIRSIWLSFTCDFFAAADVCAHGQMAQIGGFIKISNRIIWFSERFTPQDFYSLDVEVNHDMQRDIACYETLAQLAVIKLMSQHIPAQRYSLRISSLSDNTGAEAGVNSLFATKIPLAFFWKSCASQLLRLESNWTFPISAGKTTTWQMQFPAGTLMTIHRTVLIQNLDAVCHSKICGWDVLMSHFSLVTLPCLGSSPHKFNLLNEHIWFGGIMHCMFIPSRVVLFIWLLWGLFKFHLR